MATVRRKLNPEKEYDCLIISKSKFSSVLLERIAEGKTLLEENISTPKQLDEAQLKYSRWDQWNVEFLKQSFNNEHNEYKTRYYRLNDFAGSKFFSHRTYTPTELHKLHLTNSVEFLERLHSQLDLLKSSIENTSAVPNVSSESIEYNCNVFIVHGHNVAVLQNVARVIEKLKMTPIILSERPNEGKTVIEKFEANSDVGFVIVLLTDDDLGNAKAIEKLNYRARQNVILELGYFMGKLGRKRVMPLYVPGVELPSDIHGLLYTEIDAADKWKFQLVKELKQAGYSVDANLIL